MANVISPLSCETDRVLFGSAGVGALGARMVTVQTSFGCCCRRRYAGFRIVPVTAKSQATESTAGGLARVPPTRCLKPWRPFAHLGADSTVRSIRPWARPPPTAASRLSSRRGLPRGAVRARPPHAAKSPVADTRGDARIDIKWWWRRRRWLTGAHRARPHPSDLSLAVAGKVRSPLSTGHAHPRGAVPSARGSPPLSQPG